jgi:hypothetical protein
MSDRYDHDQAQTGIGASRTGGGIDVPPSNADAETSDALIVGATTASHPSEAGAGGANRSGSGGSGGSGDPGEEGSGGQSMEELLTGDDPAADAPR